MVQIIPAVLTKTEEQYKIDIERLASCEALANGWVHIDFADNKFVQNKTVGVETIQKFPTNFRKEAHLMVCYPKQWIDGLVEAVFERIIFHIECENNIGEMIGLIKGKGLEVGLAINNETPIEKLEPFASKMDVVLVMSIVPGFQGQPFIRESVDKIRKLKSKGWKVRLGIDGAVKDDNIKEIVNAGVDFVTVGSYLLKGDIDENLEHLWEVLNE